jgi:hypothetical protein
MQCAPGIESMMVKDLWEVNRLDLVHQENIWYFSGTFWGLFCLFKVKKDQKRPKKVPDVSLMLIIDHQHSPLSLSFLLSSIIWKSAIGSPVCI